MAIFGDLVTISTPDVLKMLGSRTGKLYIHSTTQKQYELHLYQGAVLCFREDDVSVKVKETLQKSLVELFGLRQGKFDFGPTHEAVLSHEIHMTRQEVWQLLANTTIESRAEINPATDKTTRFKLKDSSQLTAELPSNLQSFLQRSRSLLFAGCSASELATVVKLPVPLVQLYLIRLRSLDIITPVRAYAVNYRGYEGSQGDGYGGEHRDDNSGGGRDNSAGDRVSNTDNGGGLLERVSRPVSRAGYQPESTALTLAPSSARPSAMTSTVTSAAAPQPSAAVSPFPALPSRAQQLSAESPTPKRSFIRRLLAALSFGGKR